MRRGFGSSLVLNAFEVKVEDGGRRFLRRETLLSAGVACYPKHGATGADMLHTADQDLYAAKNAGRDRVVVFGREDGAANG